jgi:hypothetical protein
VVGTLDEIKQTMRIWWWTEWRFETLLKIRDLLKNYEGGFAQPILFQVSCCGNSIIIFIDNNVIELWADKIKSLLVLAINPAIVSQPTF